MFIKFASQNLLKLLQITCKYSLNLTKLLKHYLRILRVSGYPKFLFKIKPEPDPNPTKYFRQAESRPECETIQPESEPNTSIRTRTEDNPLQREPKPNPEIEQN